MVLKKAESELEYNKVISLLLELQKDHSDQYPRLFRDYIDHVQFKKLSVSHANQSSINLYESLGFEKEMMYMSCEL